MLLGFDDVDFGWGVWVGCWLLLGLLIWLGLVCYWLFCCDEFGFWFAVGSVVFVYWFCLFCCFVVVVACFGVNGWVCIGCLVSFGWWMLGLGFCSLGVLGLGFGGLCFCG